MKFELREYQKKASDDIDYFLNESSFVKGVMTLPTSAGKSLIVAMIAEKCKGNVLVLQPSKELLEQNYQKALSFGLKPTIFSASLNSKEVSKLTYATPMSCIKAPELFKNVEIIIVDEAHTMFTSKVVGGKVVQDGETIKFIKSVNPKKIIGLTATPIQLIGGFGTAELKMMVRSKRSYWYKAEMFHVTQIRDISEKYWAEVEYIKRDVDESKLELNSTGTDFRTESIVEMYNENNINERIVEEYEDLLKKGKKSILIFVPDIETAEYLKTLHKDFEVVHSKIGKKDRDRLITDFKSGKIKAIINVSVLTIGFDHPELDAIIMARSTNSFAVYLQTVGRIVRPIIKNGNIIKKKGTIIDFTNNISRFGKVENITFENNDYTRGWGMWNGDYLLTGVPFGKWKMPQRDDIIEMFEKQNLMLKKRSGNADMQKIHRKELLEYDDFDKVIFEFGKYKGRSVKWVWEKNNSYIMWLVNKSDFQWLTDKMKEFKSKLDRLIAISSIEGGSKN